MDNSETAILFRRYKKLTALCEQYKEVYIKLEEQYKICSCFHCKLRLITLGMNILDLNSRIEHLDKTLLPSVEHILTAMNITYISEEGVIKLVQ